MVSDDFFDGLQEKIPIEEVFAQLRCSQEGLTSEEGASRLQIFGLNKLEEKKVSEFCNIAQKLIYRSFFAHLNNLYIATISSLVSLIGKQSSEVFRLYVEPIIMGYGVSSYHGNCPSQR